MKKSRHKEIIETLHKGNFYADCPCCGSEIPLRKTGLFANDNFSNQALNIYEEQLELIRERKNELKELRDKGATKSGIGAKSINIGFILERIAPTMKRFRFNHNDCRSLFDPIDYIIFEGLTTKGRYDKIFFVDIKTGKARLNMKQREIKGLIGAKKVEFKKY
jgi:predicted Holliday junction resolvase-like endonuclease